MKIDAGMVVTNMKQIPARVRELEEAGFDGCFTFEGPHEPFMPLVLAAEHSKLQIGTGLAIAFARTPMTARSKVEAATLPGTVEARGPRSWCSARWRSPSVVAARGAWNAERTRGVRRSNRSGGHHVRRVRSS